jgi:hypothetical protein
MSDVEKTIDYFESDTKLSECRRQSDQLDYFSHAYCQLYGEWQDASARVAEIQKAQPLLIALTLLAGAVLLTIAASRGNNAISAAVAIITATIVYAVIDRTRRELLRHDEIRRAKDSFGVSLYLTGVDLSLPILEESVSKDISGNWGFNNKYAAWRGRQLSNVFFRVYGVVVPQDVIETICRRPG